MQPEISVSESGDLNFLKEAIRGLEGTKVYVGIPEDETIRPNDPTGAVTNAGLMYIHTNGSELRGIPPRPVIEPAIEASGNKENIEDGLNSVVNARLDGNIELAKNNLEATGRMGANAAKRWFTDPRNGWKDITERTKAQRKGDPPYTPLVDTGELRRSITYVTEIE